MNRRAVLYSAAAGAAFATAGCTDFLNKGTDSDTQGGSEESSSGIVPGGIGSIPEGFVSDGGAFATSIDWSWYISTYNTEIGLTGEQDVGWSLEPSQSAISNAPANRVLRTPVYGVFFTVSSLSQALTQYGSLAGPIFNQLGVPEDADSFQESNNRVNRLMLFGTPGVVVLSGDLDRGKLIDGMNDFVHSGTEYGFDIYEGVPGEPTDTGDLRVGVKGGSVVLSVGRDEDAISEGMFSRILQAQAEGKDAIGESQPMIEVGGTIEPAPVIIGELGGRRFPIVDSTGYADRGVDTLEGPENIVHAFRTNGTTATAQVAIHNGGKLETEELSDAFDPVSGEYEYNIEESVASVMATWE
jgi:hypothetical protein